MFLYPYSPKKESATCVICGRSSPLISKAMGICGDCIKKKPEEALPVIRRVHAESRSRFGLTPEQPRDARGVRCRICVRECSIPEGGMGYCGLRKNVSGKLVYLAVHLKKGLSNATMTIAIEARKASLLYRYNCRSATLSDNLIHVAWKIH